MPALRVEATALTAGAWTARWNSLVVGIRGSGCGWQGRVWSWSRTARVQIAERSGLTSSVDAVSWACMVLSDRGAVALVDGQVQSLASFLVFSPAPERVP